MPGDLDISEQRFRPPISSQLRSSIATHLSSSLHAFLASSSDLCMLTSYTKEQNWFCSLTKVSSEGVGGSKLYGSDNICDRLF